MPNGRSGGFIIETADLKELIKGVSDTTILGQVVHSLPLRPANAAEINRFVEACPHDRVAVEEQGNTCYVIHLSNEPELIWLVITSEMPIFPALQQRHARWLDEHPGWNGWIGF